MGTERSRLVRCCGWHCLDAGGKDGGGDLWLAGGGDSGWLWLAGGVEVRRWRRGTQITDQGWGDLCCHHFVRPGIPYPQSVGARQSVLSRGAARAGAAGFSRPVQRRGVHQPRLVAGGARQDAVRGPGGGAICHVQAVRHRALAGDARATDASGPAEAQVWRLAADGALCVLSLGEHCGLLRRGAVLVGAPAAVSRLLFALGRIGLEPDALDEGKKRAGAKPRRGSRGPGVYRQHDLFFDPERSPSGGARRCWNRGAGPGQLSAGARVELAAAVGGAGYFCGGTSHQRSLVVSGAFPAAGAEPGVHVCPVLWAARGSLEPPRRADGQEARDDCLLRQRPDVSALRQPAS